MGKHIFKVVSASLFMGMGALVMGSAYVTVYEYITGESFHYN